MTISPKLVRYRSSFSSLSSSLISQAESHACSYPFPWISCRWSYFHQERYAFHKFTSFHKLFPAELLSQHTREGYLRLRLGFNCKNNQSSPVYEDDKSIIRDLPVILVYRRYFYRHYDAFLFLSCGIYSGLVKTNDMFYAPIKRKLTWILRQWQCKGESSYDTYVCLDSSTHLKLTFWKWLQWSPLQNEFFTCT